MDENTPTTAVPQTDYVDKTYKVMQVAYGKDFTLDDKTFRSKIQSDTNYANKVYQVMQHQYGDKFTLDSKAFNAKLGNSQQPVQKTGQPQTPVATPKITNDQADAFIKGLNPMVKDQLDKVSQGTPEEVEAKLKANNVPQEQIDKALKYKQAVDRNRVVANVSLPTLNVTATGKEPVDKTAEQQEQNKTDQFNLKLGQSFVANGKVDEGLSLIQSVSKNNPDNKDYADYTNRMAGYANTQKQYYAKSAEFYDAIKDKNNDDYNNAAFSKIKSGNLAGASSDINKVLTSPLTVDNIDQHICSKKMQLALAQSSGNEDMYKETVNGLNTLELRKSQINGEFTSANFEDFADNLPFFMQPFYKGEYKGIKDIEAGYEQGGAAGFTKSLMGATGVIMNAVPAVAEFNVGSAVLAKGTDKIQSLFVDDPEKLMKQGGIGTTVTNTVSDYLFGAFTKGLKEVGLYDMMPESLQNLSGAGDLILGGFILHKTIGFAKDIRDIGKDVEKTMPFPDAKKSLIEKIVNSFKNVSTILTNKKDGKPNTQADAENIVKDADEALKNPQVVDHIKAQLEQSNERDKVVTEAQAKGTLKPDVEIFTLPKTQETLNNIKNGTPTLNVDLDEVSNNLYEEYKRLEKTKAADTRTNTIEQITDKQNELVKQITELENKKNKQVETGEFDIKSVVPVIEGKDGEIFSGEDHAEAIKKAQDAGNDIPDVTTPEGEKFRQDNGKFEVTDNSGEKKIVTREEAKDQLGFDHSEDIPEELKPKEEDELKGDPLENINEKEYPRWVLANSEDPSEIASAYHQETTNTPFQSLKDWQKSIITGESGYGKTTEKSFINHSDKNNITDGLAKMWFNNKKGVPLDRISSELTNDEVSPSDIADFMEDVATKQISIRKTTDIQNELRKKYKEITGRSINSHRESMDDDIADIINKEGITFENFDAIKKAYPDFMFDTPEDKEDYFNKVKTRLENGNKKTETKQEPASTTETGQTVSGGEKTDRAAIEKDYKERLAEHDSKIAEATTDYNKKQFAYDKAKSELSKNAKQDQTDLFKKGTPSDEMLFKNDIKEQEDMVKNLKKESDSAKDNLDKLTKERDNVQPENQTKIPDKKLSKKEQALKDLEDARAAFRKAGGLSSGGLESLPEFVNLVKAYIKAGYETAKEFIEQFRKDYPELSDKIADKDIEDKFNDAVKEKEEDEKPKSFNDHVFESINSATDAADLKNKLSDKEKEFRDAGKYDEADKIKELNNSIKDGDDIGDVTNKILDDQIKEADPFRKTKTEKAKEFISDSAIGNFGKKIFTGVKFIFNKVFPLNSKVAQEARQILRKEQGNLKSEIANLISGKSSGFFENLGINAWSNSLESVRNLFDKIGKDGSFKFMNIMQGIVDGKTRDATLKAMDKQYGLEEGTLQKALDNLRNTSDKLYDMVAEHSDVPYVVDYLAGMYKDYEKARVYFAGKLNNIAGKKSFLKQKFYDNYLQAVSEGGLKPLYDNPADIVNHQVGNVMQYVYANRILDAFKDNGMAEYYPNAKDVPEGMSLVKDPIFQRKTFIPPTEEGKPAVVTEAGGGWYLPNDAADMVNNKFGKGLIAPEVESSVQALNNFYVRADLSFSYFHTMMSSMNSLASQFGGAIQNLTAFKPLAALKELARVPLAQDLFEGIKLNRDAKRVDDLKQQLADANSKGNTKVAADLQKRINNVKMLTDANHQFNLDRQNRMDVVDAFRRSVRRNEKLPSLIKAPLAAVDAFMRPLMQVYVPALKSAVAMRNAAREIELVQPNTEFERQNLINRAVDGSDEMFGQIAHDNLFFDNTLKQLGNMSALAFGYSRGTLMTLLRPVTELGKFQQGEGGGFKSETINRLVKGKGVPIGTSNFLGIVASTCFVGAMMQKLMSGKDPESIQDLIAPRTGEKNPDGTDKRLIFSNYLSKDYYGYSKGFFHELENKSSPLIRITSELVKNKDFYGGVIMPEDEPLWNKAWNGVKFAGKEAIPFSFRHNPAKEYEDYSKGKEDLMQYFGIREASKEMERNTWQNAIVDESAKSGSEKPKTDLQLDKARLKGTAAGEIYSGEEDKGKELLQKGVTKGYWKQSEVGKMAEDFKVNPYYRMFKTLSPEGQLRVYKEMTPEVQEQLKPYLHKPDVWEKLKKEMPEKSEEINKVTGTENPNSDKVSPDKESTDKESEDKVSPDKGDDTEHSILKEGEDE